MLTICGWGQRAFANAPDSIHLASLKGAALEITRAFATHRLPEIISDPIIIPQMQLDDSVQYHRQKALAYKQQVVSNNAFVNSFSEALQVQLPVGISSRNGDLGYAIIISQIRTTTRSAFVDAYLLLELPGTGDKIAFRGRNIEFSNDGGFTGNGRLELVGDYFIQPNDKTLAWLIGKGQTFVEFDCNGFKGMGLQAEVQFSRELFIPEDNKGQPLPNNQRLKTEFFTYAQSWSDILIGVTLPPFQINGLPGFGFRVTQAFLDWSDRANPPSLAFPPGYVSPFQTATTPQAGTPGAAPINNPVNLWQGFYLSRLEVRLPTAFKPGDDSTRRVTLGAERMLIDDQGLSGVLFGENLLSNGRMSGWSYTLDRLAFEVVTNNIRGFELSGTLSVPMLKTHDGKPTRFGYTAQQDAQGNYLFATRVNNELQLPLFAARLNLLPGSTVTVTQRNNRFYPTAVLNGMLAIRGTERGPRPELLGIPFEGLRLSTEEPGFDIQSVGLGREGQQQRVSQYPVIINNISVRKETNRVGIGFNLTINVAGDGAFGGTAGLVVWGKREVANRTDAESQVVGQDESGWRFDKIDLSAIGIKAKKPGVYDIDGLVNFFDDDAMYGAGFNGRIRGSIGKTADGIKFNIYALFGRTPSFRYWYVDALASFKPGLPIVPGVLNATGLGGGYYHRMKQGAGNGLGRAPSGITYIPDENSRGLRAMLQISTPRPEMFNGLVTLEIVMNRNGGINSTTLVGNAEFLNFREVTQEKVKELAGDAATGQVAGKLAAMLGGQMYANVVLIFDNVNDVFHGTMETYINVAGGLVRGVGQGNRSGWAVVHFEQNYWQVLIGTPTQPLGIEIARLFRSRSYFMAGKDLPGSPPPPDGAIEILGGRDMDYMRELNAIESGTGMAFGLSFGLETGRINFLMFYGRFSAGAGADLMLRDFGNSFHCVGANGPLGINGWYANGQVYAFLLARIGIRVNLKFYKGEYDILSLRVAAILQAKGPNPFWMRGVVAGDYRILGGLVKGHCRFEVTVGQDCQLRGEQELLADVGIIAQLSPTNDSRDVDVFNTPQVAFNIPVGDVFEITDLDNRKRAFRALLNEFSVKDGAKNLPGQLVWNSTKDVVVFDGHDLLPGETKLKAIARLTFQEQINGVWQTSTFQGKPVEEVAQTTFETGKAPDFIPPNNVLLSYPLTDMVNFYPKEFNRGFIQLKYGQSYLFAPGPEWEQKVRMSSGSRFVETDFTYNTSAKRIDFTLPAGFENTKVYQFQILNLPRKTAVMDANVQNLETQLAATDAGSATLTTKNIEGTAEKLETKSIYSSTFRTSRYNTFVEKMRAIRLATPSFRADISNNVFRLTSRMSGAELFDSNEMPAQHPFVKGLIDVEAILNDNSWFNNYVQPLVYEGYPLFGLFRITHRDPGPLGIPPAKDIYFAGFNQLPSSPTSQETFTGRELIAYNLNESVHLDYRDLARQGANFIVNNPSANSPRLRDLLLKPAPRVRYGEYKVRFNYFIPGQATPSSFFEWTLFNAIPDNDRN